uniref:SWIM-type domain-containing protein n=1 Tax=Syphacia muris TaxID=451379 RepID=A0A0N5AHE9_9BILA
MRRRVVVEEEEEQEEEEEEVRKEGGTEMRAKCRCGSSFDTVSRRSVHCTVSAFRCINIISAAAAIYIVDDDDPDDCFLSLWLSLLGKQGYPSVMWRVSVTIVCCCCIDLICSSVIR